MFKNNQKNHPVWIWCNRYNMHQYRHNWWSYCSFFADIHDWIAVHVICSGSNNHNNVENWSNGDCGWLLILSVGCTWVETCVLVLLWTTPNVIKCLQMWSWVDRKTHAVKWLEIIALSCLRPKVLWQWQTTLVKQT